MNTKHIENTIIGGIHNTIKQIFLYSILLIYAYTTGSTISRIHVIKLRIGKLIQRT